MRLSFVISVCVVVVCLGMGEGAQAAEEQAPAKKNPYLYNTGQTSNDLLTRLQSLAMSGDSDACYTLGAKYINGEGVPQDYSLGVKWLKLAAEDNHAYAQFDLARVYLVRFDEFQQNKQMAYFWANLAAAHDTLSPRELDKALKLRVLIEEELTEDEVRASQQAATLWLEKHKKNMN